MSDFAATRERNQTIISYLESPGLEKRGTDAIESFTRTTMREDGFLEKIIPQQTITNAELTRRVDTEMPWYVVDKENGSPAAITLGFAQLPTNYTITGDRYAVQFCRLQTVRFNKDLDLLRSYVMDVRQVMSDNAVKDMLAEEDGNLIYGVGVAIGNVGTTQTLANTILNRQISGSMGRTEVVEMLKILQQTVFRLNSHTCLTNQSSWLNFMKWGRDEMGGDKAEDIIVNGMHMSRFLDRNWVVTIKNDLVPDEVVYQFPEAKFIGKNLTLEPTTMYSKREGPMLEWYFYKSIGCSLGHISFAKTTFV
jgi:hypothetical protein